MTGFQKGHAYYVYSRGMRPHVNKPRVVNQISCFRDLSNMELTGKLPGDFQAMQWIADLCLEHNQFTGTLPESWSAIGSLASDVEL